jgi:hypothetical protein
VRREIGNLFKLNEKELRAAFVERGKKAYVSFTEFLLAAALEVEPLPSPPFAAFLAASSFSSLCFCKLKGCTPTRFHLSS